MNVLLRGGGCLFPKKLSSDHLLSVPHRDPLSEHPDVHAPPVFGPSLLFSGTPARWTGDVDGHVGIEARVTFEAFAGQRVTSHLEVANDGTTAIYYDWRVSSESQTDRDDCMLCERAPSK